jgi:hypothetical protein
MELNNRQLAILNGMLLGDAYLQKTGSKNARLRLEHSFKQRALMNWKFAELEHIFQSRPQFLERVHPATKNINKYVRLQSYAFPFLGELQRQFYDNNGFKKLPDSLEELLASPITIAVWYMDDGYYDQRDKSAHLYLQAFDVVEIQRLIYAFRAQYGLECKAYCRPDREACQLNFRREDKDKLLKLVEPHLIEEMKYKLPLDPVTTEPERAR